MTPPHVAPLLESLAVPLATAGPVLSSPARRTVALDLGADARLADPAWLHALWLAPAVVLIAFLAARARKAALRRLGDPKLVERLAPVGGGVRRWVRVWLVAAAVALAALALARPQRGEATRDVERRGRDLVFLVDVSRSMLARDLAPNRLERAKLWINDLVDDLGGDRVGLVAFAGAPSIKSPLTEDRAFFRLALERLTPDSAPRGGTNLGDAIRKALDDVFQVRTEEGETVETGRYRDIILITDGEDQESFPVRAAQVAAEHGVRIIAIGLGDPDRGTPVPVDERSEAYLRYGGERVLSRLDASTLTEIAGVNPANAYLEVGTAEIDLAQVYRDLIASAEQGVLGSSTITDYEEQFGLFLALAAALLAVEPLIGERAGRRATA